MRSVHRTAAAAVAATLSALLSLLAGAPTAWASPAPPVEPGRGDMPDILPATHAAASTPAATSQAMSAWELAAFGIACAAAAVLITLAVARLVSRHRAAPSRSAEALAA